MRPDLIQLAATNGIDASPERFRHSKIGRSRLGAALSGSGIDLDFLSLQQPPKPDEGVLTPLP